MRERTRPPTPPRRHPATSVSGATGHWHWPGRVSARSVAPEPLQDLHEQRSVTPDMALRLAQALHTTPELWLNLQRTYDLWHAARQSEDWRQVQELVTAR